MKAARNAVLFIIGAGLAAWIVVLIINNVQENTSAVAKQPMSVTTAADKDDLRVDAWIEDSRLDPRDPINYWITATNRAKQSVASDVRLITFKHPGLDEITGLTNQPFALKPGEVAVFNGQLVASSQPGKYGIGAVVAWKEGTVERRKPIGIGPITIENPTKRGYLRALRTLQGIIKDIALPVALAVIAWFFTKIENDRETARKELEEGRQRHEKAIEQQRDELQQKTENRRVRLHQTWTLMLPKVHEYAERYYLPASVDASAVSKYYQGPNQDPDLCFYFYFLYLAQMKQMIDKISGFYLRYRNGEEVVGTLWEMLLDLADARYGRKDRERAQSLVNPLWTSAEFDDNIATNTLIIAMRAKLLASAEYAKFAADVAVLELFALLIAYETNCSYEFWYEPERLDEDAWQQSFNAFVAQKSLYPPKKYAQLLKTLEEHHASLPKRESSS